VQQAPADLDILGHGDELYAERQAAERDEERRDEA
jgi:hypothetical protein